MNEHILKIESGLKINFNPNRQEEILQNVAMIMTAVVSSCPMDRDFAWNGNLLDRPINVVKSLLSSRLINAVNKYEPRAEITDITFNGDSGIVQPCAKVRILDG